MKRLELRQMIREILLNESDKKFWKNVYKKEEAHWEDKEISNLTKSIVRKYDNFKNVLEIGCAAGVDTFFLAKYTDKITGIDIVEDVIRIAKENLKKQPIKIQKKVVFETGDAEKLKYKDGIFDFVYSLSVLHTTDINKSLKEIRRVLNDDGKAVIYVFTKGNIGDKVVKKKDFIEVCEKYFDIEEQEEVDLIDKDSDQKHKHKALIVYLKKL